MVRLAIVAASLAWAGFVFTHTVGDPDRGERIAAAVLADDDARAEIVTPITSAVMTSTGLPAENRSFVSARVDDLLRDPAGAQAFVDPFAASYARMLGEDDPGPSEFDLAPLTDELVAGVPGLDATSLPTGRFEIPSVPLPDTELGWMADARAAIATATPWLALAALVGIAVGLVIGDPRWVLRRAGVWAGLAGGGWVIVPVALAWAARRWAAGADSVVAVAVGEAVGGLRVAAMTLLAVGITAVGASYLPSGRRVPTVEPADRSRTRRTGSTPAPAEPTVVGPVAPIEHPTVVAPTAVLPDRRPVDPAGDAPPSADPAGDVVAEDPDGERDPLWEYYAP